MAASEAFSSATATRPDARRAEVVGHRQHTGHRAHRAVEGQLADEPVAVDPERTVAEAEDGHGDAEVECSLAPLIRHLGKSSAGATVPSCSP